MTKSRRRPDNPGQLSLLDYISQKKAESTLNNYPGSLNVQLQLKECISRMLKQCPLSRYQVAARMSELTGANVTRFMLDAWSAESKELHRFPAEFIPALCEATGSQEILELLTDRSGLFCLPGPDALRAEVNRLEEKIRELQEERRKRILFLREMGGEEP